MLILAGSVTLFSSFADGDDAGGTIFQQLLPPRDCSTSQIVYQLVTSSGAGAGYASVSTADGTTGGQVGGSGSGSSLFYGPKGSLYTPQVEQPCEWSLFSQCTPVLPHATGPATFTKF